MEISNRLSEPSYADLMFNHSDQGYIVLEVLYDANDQPVDIYYIEANPAANRMTGLELAGKRTSELDPNYEKHWFEIMGRIATTGVAEKHELSANPLGVCYQVHAIKVGTTDERKVAVIYEDVTERKQVEKTARALRKSEEQFRMFVTASSNMVYKMSTDWKNMYALNGKNMLADTDQTTGNWVDKYIPEEHQALVWQKIAEAIDSKGVFELEHQVIQADGSIGWVLSRAVPVVDSKGMITEWLGLGNDITERKQTEEALRQSEAAYRLRLEQEVSERTAELKQVKDLLQKTVDSSHDMIQVFNAVRDEHGKIIDFIWILNNATSEKINGSTTGESLLEHNPGVILTGIFDHFVQVTETGIPQQYEINYTYENFNAWYQQSVVKLNDGVATTSSEISGRKKTEIELNESLNLLKTIYDTTLIGMLVFAPVRNDQGAITDFRFVTVNKEIGRTTGRFDLAGKLYADLYPGIRQMGLFDLMVTTMETGETGKMEYHYTYEGIDSWYSTMFVRGDDFLVCTNLDITERMQAEDERFRNYTLLQQSEGLAEIGSWDYDLLTGNFVWSDGMYRLFDLQRGIEIQPEIYLEYATPDSLTVAERLVSHIRNGDQDFEETITLNVNSKVKIVHIKAAVVKNNDGQLTRVLGVDLDMTAIHEAERRLRDLEVRQQQEIFQITLNTQEEERRRISESLHNGVGQLLYGTRIAMNYLTVKMATENSDKFNKSKAYTEGLLTDSIKDIRRISHELMPTVLAEFGLSAAIKEVGEQLQDSIQFNCQVSLGNVKLDNYVELAVFRTVQELMTNVVKHSKATQAEVTVEASSTEVQILVHDNGIGMQAAEGNKQGIGLSSIRNKVAMLGGNIAMQSAPAAGTTITINLPHQLEG
ncbi:PAS domain-containing protein [Mucilaginibacter sp. RB4R14]|uniref:sensor histidine kinase n=1 Tax=Mucilaginibacter aurantiaciroseus TaxID=2949308 RepID=UPI002090FE85|nr:PAS domain-containing protein [Mucilaginibacter aurantiaciroseus]MCO5936518.1 PAS domain-containing protein [Mucilaginibacter aurantiaciroseus]